MKTLLIASFVGAVILYVALAVMHMFLNIHESEFKYTSGQDSILNVLNSTIKEDGVYFVPNLPSGSSHETKEAYMTEQMGKPFAVINYVSSMTFGAKQFIMGFVYNWVAVLILCVMLAAANEKLNGFSQRLWFVLLAALFVIFSSSMMSYNWEQMPMHYIKGRIIDNIVGYLASGIWLAWYYGRRTSKT